MWSVESIYTYIFEVLGLRCQFQRPGFIGSFYPIFVRQNIQPPACWLSVNPAFRLYLDDTALYIDEQRNIEVYDRV